MDDFIEIIKKHTESGITVTPESYLKDDLALDSFSMMELLCDIETELQLKIKYELLPNVKTVLDFEQCFYKE